MLTAKNLPLEKWNFRSTSMLSGLMNWQTELGGPSGASLSPNFFADASNAVFEPLGSHLKLDRTLQDHFWSNVYRSVTPITDHFLHSRWFYVVFSSEREVWAIACLRTSCCISWWTFDLLPCAAMVEWGEDGMSEPFVFGEIANSRSREDVPPTETLQIIMLQT